MEGRARQRGGGPKGGPWLRVRLFLLICTLAPSLIVAVETAVAVAAAAETVSSPSLDAEAQQALETLLAAGIVSPPAAESAILSREEVALWLYRLLTYLEKEDFLTTDSEGTLVLSPAARAALQRWVADQVAAQLAAGLPARERMIERQVVVEAGPQVALPALTRAEEALRQAREALESALAAQQEAIRAQEATGAISARLQAVEEELLAARQALGALEAPMRELSQLSTAVAELTDRVASLNRDLAALQAALGAADQRVTAVDLRVAATQGDIETLRLLLDRRVEELAASWGIDKEKLEAGLAETRNRVAAVEKDAVRQEALAAITALVEARSGDLEAAINQLAEELRPELGRLDQRLAAVETQLGRLDERVSALEAALKDQGIRLQRMEERTPALTPQVWAAWVSTEPGVTGSTQGNVRYGLQITWDRRGQEGVLADLAGSWQSEWEPGSGSLWQKLQLSKPVGTGLTGDVVLAWLPVVPGDGGPAGESGGIRPLAVQWAMGIRKETENWPDLALTWGGSSVAPGQWWRAQISAPLTEAGAPLQVAVSGWLAGGLTAVATGSYPYLHVPGPVEEVPGSEVGYRLLAETRPRDGSLIAGGWEWRQSHSAPGKTAREGWLSLQLPVGDDAYLSLAGRRWWFSGPGSEPRELTELRASLRLDL